MSRIERYVTKRGISGLYYSQYSHAGTLEGPRGYTVVVAAFSPDGQLVVTGSRDPTARIWDISTGDALSKLSYRIGDDLSFTFKCPKPSLTKSFILNEACDWVCLATSNIFWIPHDRRPAAYAVRDNYIVLASGSGRVTFLSLDAHAHPSI